MAFILIVIDVDILCLMLMFGSLNFIDVDRCCLIITRCSLILLEFDNIGNPTAKTSKTNKTIKINKNGLRPA